MEKNYFKIVVSLVFLLSAFNGVAQTDEKPVLERYSSSSTSQQNKEESNVVPELKKSSVNTTNNNRIGSEYSEQLVAPQLKRFDSQSAKNEQPK